MLWFVCFFNYADRQSIAAVFPELEREFGFNKEQLGLIGSAFMWVYAGCALFAGLVCDRFRRKDLILGGCLACDDESLEAQLFEPGQIPWDELAFRSTKEALEEFLKRP